MGRARCQLQVWQHNISERCAASAEEGGEEGAKEAKGSSRAEAGMQGGGSNVTGACQAPQERKMK